ncbi:hypothetical protein N7G274_010902 [Stereocaulon virgatum]|uniref:Required for respiratory growth protein 9, mitochondrial n=1 Tax=Stereocaulon virgatum TaxID=373712 RepID=A0ABR3ZUU9_9LECA
MPSSAYATNVLWRFLGSLDLGVSTRSLRTAPSLYRTRARTVYNASSAPQKLSTAVSVVDMSQPSDSMPVNDVSATFTNPAIERNSSLQQNGIGGKTSTLIDLHITERKRDAQSVKGGRVFAGEDSAPLAENENPQAKNPDSNGLDKGWLERNTRNLRAENGQYRSARKVVEHAESAQESDQHSDEPNLATQSNSPSADLTSPLPQANILDKDCREEYSHILRDKNDRHRRNPKTAERAESARKGDRHSDDKTKSTTTSTNPKPELPPLPKNNPLDWQVQKYALTKKFSSGWVPRKRLSPDTLEGIRNLHAQYPTRYTTPVLADQFKVSPEAIRRILKSKWRPSEEEEEKRRERWEKRGKKIWEDMSEKGVKPPRRWRTLGVGKRKPEGGWEKGPTRRGREDGGASGEGEVDRRVEDGEGCCCG